MRVKLILIMTAAGQHRVIALTNNYSATQDVEPAELEYLGWKEGATPPALRALFDDFCDSSTLGMRYYPSRPPCYAIETSTASLNPSSIC
jgi:hypothetical protein